MKLLLLSPCPQINNMSSTQYPPLGLLYIGSYVKDIVDCLQILDANVMQLNTDDTIEKIKDFAPDILGISINVATAKSAKCIVEKVKKQMPNVKTIAGGPHPTISPEEWLKYFDIVIAGEGEVPFRSIISQFNAGKNIEAECQGICLPNGEITHACHPDIDMLPFPAYDCLNPDIQYYSKKARVIKPYMAPILTSRGCPYSCSFCDKSVHGINFRPRSVESVLNEIKWLYEKYGVRQLDILDDNFTFDKARAHKILDGIIEIGNFKINCQNGIRADRIDNELAIKMKKAGVFRVGIGIESGNPEILKRLNKQLNLEDVTNAIRMLRNQRITTQGYFIIGLPFECASDIQDTINYAIKANPTFANFAHYFPIMGTTIYDELKKNNKLMIENGEIEDGFFRSASYIKNPNISFEDMARIYGQAWRQFYFRISKIVDVLMSVKSWRELLWIARISLSMFKSKLLRK